MDEGTVLCLRMLLGLIMFGLLVGVIAIIWKEVGSFVCSLVETVKVREPSEDIVDGEEVGSFEGGSVETVKVREPSEDVVDGEDEPNCVLAADEDFSDTDNGEFRYKGGAGKLLILGVLIGFIMFRLFAGATAIFGDGVGSFVGGSVETVKVRESSEDVVDGEDEHNCVIATDEDFSGTDNGEFRYIGSSDCVKIPHVIKDEEMTSYHKITDMSYMFNSIQDTEVDLSNFDTTTEEDLSYMFEVKPQS